MCLIMVNVELTVALETNLKRFCDLKGVLKFTGFKVHRQYRFSGFKPKSHQYLIMSHCNHGKLEYQKAIELGSINEVDWNSSFCFLKPQNDPWLQKDKSVSSLVRNGDNDNGDNDSDNGDNDSEDKSLGVDKRSNISAFTNAIKLKISKFLEKITQKSKHIEYLSPPTRNHRNDINNSSLQASLEWESKNLMCLKMARRKKYARRSLTFYMPETFVGGLFDCPLLANMKADIFSNFSTKDTLKGLNFDCDSSLAKPLLPLIADYSTNQWFEPHFNIFNPSVVQTIPFLTTANPWNLRFSISETPDMYKETWAKKIHVDEDYDFNQVDLHLISQATAMSANHLIKLLNPIDFGKLLQNNENIHNIKVAGRSITENDFFINAIKSLANEQKVDILLSSNPEQYLSSLKKLQDIWEMMLKDCE